MKTLARHKILLALLIVSGVALLGAGVVTFLNAARFTGPVMLHAYREGGVDRIGTVADYVGIYAFGLVVWSGSVLIASVLLDAAGKRRYAYVALGLAFCTALFTLVAVSYIAGLN